MSPSTETIRPHPRVGSELVRNWPAEIDSPRGRIVVVHGVNEHSGRYERLGGQLSAAGFETTAFDLIGHGSTGGRRGHIENWSDFLDQVEHHVTVAREHQEPVILLGHSMGGLIAAEYLIADRPPPHLLVLSAPALRGGANWQVRLAPYLASVAPLIAVPTMIKGEQLSRDPEVGESYFADPLVVTSNSARFGAELFAAMARVRRHRDGVEVPTLVIHGTDDTIVPCGASSGIDGDRVVFSGLRHELFNEPEGSVIVDEVIAWIGVRLNIGL